MKNKNMRLESNASSENPRHARTSVAFFITSKLCTTVLGRHTSNQTEKFMCEAGDCIHHSYRNQVFEFSFPFQFTQLNIVQTIFHSCKFIALVADHFLLISSTVDANVLRFLSNLLMKNENCLKLTTNILQSATKFLQPLLTLTGPTKQQILRNPTLNMDGSLTEQCH